MADPATIAHDRFGLGARPGDTLPRDLRGFLLDQIDRFDPRPAALANAPDMAILGERAAQRRALREQSRTQDGGMQNTRSALDNLMRQDRHDLLESVSMRLRSAIETDTPFPERLVHFWANHFAVSSARMPFRSLAADHEFHAIRSNLTGSFADLVWAAVSQLAICSKLRAMRSSTTSGWTARTPWPH